MTVTTLGAVFLPQFAPERLRRAAVAADEAGLDELWLWEDCFRESGIATAAAVLAWTENLAVGIGILPIPLRNVAVTAMEIATIERLFPGRLHAGVGSGVRDWMRQVGADVRSPLGLAEEYFPALKALLSGQEFTADGEYVRLDGVTLDWPPTEPMPVYFGAGGPKSLRLSGRIADGTVLTGGTTPAGVRAARNLINEGRAEANSSAPHRIVVYVMAATGSGARSRLDAEVARWGLDAAEDVAVAGDAGEVATALRRWADAGAETVVLQPTSDEPDFEGFLRFAGREVRPLLASHGRQ